MAYSGLVSNSGKLRGFLADSDAIKDATNALTFKVRHFTPRATRICGHRLSWTTPAIHTHVPAASTNASAHFQVVCTTPQGVELPLLIEPRGMMTADADEDVAVARKALTRIVEREATPPPAHPHPRHQTTPRTPTLMG